VKSKAHLKDHRPDLEAKENARSVSLEQTGGASLYRHLCHMSEANSLAEDLGLATRFRPHRKAKAKSGSKDEVVCRIFEDGELAEEIPLAFFERRFKSLQARWNQLVVCKADKRGGKAVTAMKPRTVLRNKAVVPSTSPTPAPVRAEPAAARPPTVLSQDAQDVLQRQMKKVTLETLALAEKMWQQVEMLEEASSQHLGDMREEPREQTVVKIAAQAAQGFLDANEDGRLGEALAETAQHPPTSPSHPLNNGP